MSDDLLQRVLDQQIEQQRILAELIHSHNKRGKILTALVRHLGERDPSIAAVLTEVGGGIQEMEHAFRLQIPRAQP
jgi:hypothetical protein